MVYVCVYEPVWYRMIAYQYANQIALQISHYIHMQLVLSNKYESCEFSCKTCVMYAFRGTLVSL